MSDRPEIKIRDLQDAWKAFDRKWDSTCPYHQQQANAILKAQTSQLYTGAEAMFELRELSKERERCKECRKA